MASSVSWNALPAAVQSAVEDAVPGLDVDDIEANGEGSDLYYEIVGEVNGGEVELRIDRYGDILELEIDSGSSSTGTSLPVELLEVLDEVAPGFAVEEVELTGHGETRHFQVEGMVGEREAFARLALDGSLLRFRLVHSDDESEDGDAGVEQLPQAVRDTLADIVGGMVVDAVTYNPGADHPFYRFEGTLGERGVLIVISTVGAVFRLEFDTDTDGLDDAAESDKGTDPSNRDTDGDSYPDGFESRYGSDPRAHASIPQILSIHREYVRGELKAVLSLAMFAGATFQIEWCYDLRNWRNLGEPHTGREGEVMRMPMEVAEDKIYRVSVTTVEDAKHEGEVEGQEGGETTTPGGNDNNGETRNPPRGGDGNTEGGNDGGDGCGAPLSNLEGVTLELGGLDYEFTSKAEGLLVLRGGGNGQDRTVLPFSYSYSITGECTSEVTITFMAGKEDDEREVITLTFAEEGGGNYTFTVAREKSPAPAAGAFEVAYNEPPPPAPEGT